MAAVERVRLSGFTVDAAGQVNLNTAGVINVKAFPYLAVGDGVTDDTASIRSAAGSLQAAGSGVLDFGDGIYHIFPGVNSTAPAPLVALTGLDGIEMRSAGATFVCSGDFPVNNIRAVLFSFTTCRNITMGAFVGTYTGNRTTGGVSPELGMYQRGLVFAEFLVGCENVEAGTLELSDYSIGHKYHEEDAVPIVAGTTNVRIAQIQTVRTGYGLVQHRSGHNLTASISSDTGGRSLIADYVHTATWYVKSKDHVSNCDVGLDGELADLDLTYINTDSTVAGPTGEKCIALYYTNESVAMRNIKVRYHVEVTGAVYVDWVFYVGVETGITLQEVHNLSVRATAGTFTITWSGQTTTAIAFNASAAAVQTALEALSNIAPGDVVVTGGPGNAAGTTPYILTWATAMLAVVEPTTNAGSLTGGIPASAAVVTSLSIENLDVSGVIVSPTNAQRGINIDHPSVYPGGTKISNLYLHDLRHDNHGGLNELDLTDLRDTAILQNLAIPEGAINLVGNLTSKIVCVNVEVNELVAGGDTSHVDLYSCNIITGATFSYINKNLYGTRIAGALQTRVASGPALIGTTANTKNLGGLTVSQGAADDEIVSLKSSDVAHAMTGLAEADTFGTLKKISATGGGAWLEGYTTGANGVGLNGRVTTENTTHTASGVGAILLRAQLRSGTSVTDLSTNANLMSLDNNGNTRFIVDAEGDYFSDGTGATYADYDDPMLCLAVEHHLDPKPAVQQVFAQFCQYNQQSLIEAGILAPDGPDGSRGFINNTKLIRLAIGAAWQMGLKVQQLEQELKRLQTLLPERAS